MKVHAIDTERGKVEGGNLETEEREKERGESVKRENGRTGGRGERGIDKSTV